MPMDWTIKFTDLAIIFATFAGPVAAVLAQGWIDNRRNKRRRQQSLFEALMRTRATALAPDHVNALNAVPLEFVASSQGNGEVTEAWKTYMHHLTKDTEQPQWNDRRVELLTQLLRQLGRRLGYKFDSVEIEAGAYSPRGHAAIESDQDVIRRGLAAIFRGEKTLPMTVASFPSDPDMLALWRRTLGAVADHLESPPGQRPDVDQVSLQGMAAGQKKAASAPAGVR